MQVPFEPPVADGVRRSRWLALGDPQTSFDKVIAILGHHDLLAEDGRLRPEVGLLSIGDHFDYGPNGGPAVGREGLLFLRWLVDHAPDQVVVLAGNHDLARVQELAFETDDSFAAARALAGEARALARAGKLEQAAEVERRFHQAHRHVPTVEIAARDYSGFTVEQQRLLQDLLLCGRLHLAQAGLHRGSPILFTHAGVTTRETAILALEGGLDATATAPRIAEAIERYLADRLARVAPAWRRGEPAPLDLAPLHVTGTQGREGGGFLYHRPANPARPGADSRWELDERAPRRFDPRSLAPGVTQVCGHSGHRKCLQELVGWVSEEASMIERGGVRTLRTDGNHVEYDVHVRPPRPAEATLYLIDGEIDHVPAETYRLFAFDGPDRVARR